MIKFLDLNTGYSFDGLWKDDQSKGYIFWFPNEQSINIIYSMPICILAKPDESGKMPNNIELRIEDNDVFCFIKPDISSEVFSNGKNFIKDHKGDNSCIEFKHLIDDWGEELQNGWYAHVFYVLCISENIGEFVCKINIGDSDFIRVGADFYGDYEPTYINLSNFGVEIPDTVQKAIYDSNVHEDFKDNILLNRKFKELISNYWDIIANKGSYKSLINSLKWFEWDKALNIREIYKRDEAGRIMFDDREIMSIFEDKIFDTINNFSKTTYISLYYSLQEELCSSKTQELDIYDSEYNPILIDTVSKWSRDDMALKMALMAQFFGTFFLPIHLSILHAVTEDKVFTNTIKHQSSVISKRNDIVGDLNYIESNIKNGDIFKIHNVKAQVTENTKFGIRYDNEKNLTFGVDPFPSDYKFEDLKTFSKQYYVGPGVIIPIEIIIPNQASGDFIRQIFIDYTTDNGTEERICFYDKIYSRNNRFYIKFNFLAKSAQKYNIRFTFITGTSKTITKSIVFNVEDTDNLILNVYKIQAKDDSNGLSMKDFLNTKNYDYFYKIQKNDKKYYTQYLPYMHPDNKLYKEYKGIKLNRTVVFDVRNSNGEAYIYNDYELSVIKGLMRENFLEFVKYNKENNITYLIYVSKKFYAEVPKEIINKKYNIIRNDLGFYPQFHNLVLMDGNDVNNYTISQYEAVCCAAEINHGRNNEKFRYGHLIDTAEWKFYNPAYLEEIEHNFSSNQPFVAKEDSLINSGYYDIIFTFSLTNGIKHECRRDSAFRIKSI